MLGLVTNTRTEWGHAVKCRAWYVKSNKGAKHGEEDARALFLAYLKQQKCEALGPCRASCDQSIEKASARLPETTRRAVPSACCCLLSLLQADIAFFSIVLFSSRPHVAFFSAVAFCLLPSTPDSPPPPRHPDKSLHGRLTGRRALCDGVSREGHDAVLPRRL